MVPKHLGDGNLESDADRLQTLQGLAAAQPLKGRAADGNAAWMLDVTGGNVIVIANNATATPFGNANNFSGMFLVDDTTVFGSVALFVTGGVNIAMLAAGANVSTVQGTAGKMNVYLAGSVVTIENKTGSSLTVVVAAIRTRPSQ